MRPSPSCMIAATTSICFIVLSFDSSVSSRFFGASSHFCISTFTLHSYHTNLATNLHKIFQSQCCLSKNPAISSNVTKNNPKYSMLSLKVRIKIHNFAAVNTKTKRKIASWLLLAVFVPMVVLSSFHNHLNVSTDDTECTECVQHQCQGHITQLTTPIHACVLCQFVSLSYVSAAAMVVADLLLRAHKLSQDWSNATVYALSPGVIITRGPPAV